jgi:hypothetical protein
VPTEKLELSGESLQQKIGSLYSGVSLRGSVEEQRRDTILRLSLQTQLRILSTDEFHTITDRNKNGIYHDLARFTEHDSIQMAILDHRATFSKEHFANIWKMTPVDNLANSGRMPVQIAIRNFAEAELLEQRAIGGTLVHILAGRIKKSTGDYLELLKLSRKVLSAKNRHNESVIRVIYDSGDEGVKGQVRALDTFWNHW